MIRSPESAISPPITNTCGLNKWINVEIPSPIFSPAFCKRSIAKISSCFAAFMIILNVISLSPARVWTEVFTPFLIASLALFTIARPEATVSRQPALPQ